jgi:hypothetical protein
MIFKPAAGCQLPEASLAWLFCLHLEIPFMRKHNLNGSGIKAANGHAITPSGDLQKNFSSINSGVAVWPEDDLEDDDLDDEDLDLDEDVEVEEEIEVEKDVEVTEDPEVEDLEEDLDLEEDEEEDDDL